MNKLTFDEFRKLPRSEQNVRLAELSDHDRFLARLNDFEVPKDWKGLTDEEIADLPPETRDILDQIEKWYNLNQPQKED